MLTLGLIQATPARAASTFYVSVWGSDANPGTLDAPWRTVAKGLSSLFPGDTLFVRGGTYVERITTVGYRPATQANPIRVAAYSGERPFVKGLLQIRGASYWTFDGINAVWDPATGVPEEPLVKIMHGIGWTFQNAEIWGARSYAGLLVGSSVVGQPSNWRIAGNCIHDTYAAHPPFQDHNLYIGLKPEDQPGPGIVERNLLFNASNGENIKVGLAAVGGGVDIVIRNNTLYDASENALVVGAAVRTTFDRNLMGRATGKWWYPNLRGYSVTGSGNVARENAGYAAAKFLSNTNSPTGIADGGGNVFGVDPKYISLGCGGFKPQDPIAKLFGRWAPSGDPVSGDWDGDGDETAGFVRGNTWSLNDAFDDSVDHAFAFGRADDRPVVGDWDGNGVDSPGVVRGNVWYLNNGFGPYASTTFSFGRSDDIPVVGDWDGDGIDTPGLVRGNVWYLNDGFGPYAGLVFGYGAATDVPVVGDWDGDARTTVAIVRATTWYLRNTNAAGAHELAFSDEEWL